MKKLGIGLVVMMFVFLLGSVIVYASDFRQGMGGGGEGIVSDDGGWTKEKTDGTDNGIEILDMYSAGVLSDILYTPGRAGEITYDMLDAVLGYDFVLDDSRILLANVDSFETNDPSWKFGYQETVTSCVAGPEDRGLFLYRRAPYGTSESYYTIDGQRVWMKLRWNSVVYDANDAAYDFILYLTDIGYKSADIAGMHCVLYDYVGVGYQALNFCGKGFILI